MTLRNSLCETYFTDLKIGCLVYVYSIFCGHIKIQLHTKEQTKKLNELILMKVTTENNAPLILNGSVLTMTSD
jgi:hypothetical protein